MRITYECSNRSRGPYHSRGLTTVEFALTASLFFLLMFMVVDFSLASFAKVTMQHAVREGARYAITGQVNLDPQADSDRKRAVIQKIRDHSMGFFDMVTAESEIEVTGIDGSSVSGFGAPGESIVITLNCQWPIFSPFTRAILSGSHRNFSVHASMRNEKFPGLVP
jgi:Flp pilus assembly protein TadG